MKIIQLHAFGFGANTYVLTGDNQTAIVIDPSFSTVASQVQAMGLTVQYVLLTHCHFDHVAGVPALQERGAKVICMAQEQSLVGTNADLFQHFGVPRETYQVDDTMQDGEVRTLCGMRIKAILTPGHTQGSGCYLVEDGQDKALFTGDTLFAGTIGRTDFPTGNVGQLQRSLQKLNALEGDYPVYPGHEEETTLDRERKENPFMQE